MSKSLIREKEKWTNKRESKQKQAGSLPHNTSHTFVPNFKILGVAVPEKWLMKKNLDRQTQTRKKDKNYITPPWHTMHARGIKRTYWRLITFKKMPNKGKVEVGLET